MSRPARPIGPSRRLHVAVRLLLAAAYAALAALVAAPSSMLALLLLLIAAAIRTRSSARLLTLSLLVATALEGVSLARADGAARLGDFLTPWSFPAAWRAPLVGTLALWAASVPPVAVPVLLGIARLVCLALVVGTLGAATQSTELLNVFSAAGNRVPGTRSLAYLLSATLAALPSIQSDMRRSVEVAILRGGGRTTLASPTTWATILTDILVRGLVRGQRMADTAIARGYRLSTGLRPLPFQRLRPRDVMLGAILLAPGLLCYGVIR